MQAIRTRFVPPTNGNMNIRYSAQCAAKRIVVVQVEGLSPSKNHARAARMLAEKMGDGWQGEWVGADFAGDMYWSPRERGDSMTAGPRKIEWTRVDNDTNGNPRYVCHFLNLITDRDSAGTDIGDKYAYALQRAHAIGGRKFHNKQYGGGIVFQSYNIRETEAAIHRIIGGAQ